MLQPATLGTLMNQWKDLLWSPCTVKNQILTVQSTWTKQTDFMLLPCTNQIQNMWTNLQKLSDQWQLSLVTQNSALTLIKNYINDRKEDSFDLKSLEKLYINVLAEIGKSIDSHITWFTAKIIDADIGLTVVQSTSGSKCKVFKTIRLTAVIPDAEWCQMLRKVVESIREEIFQVHKMEKSFMSDLSLPYLNSIRNWGSWSHIFAMVSLMPITCC